MKILSLDGGGIFGVAQANILERVDAFEKFDCFVGTSIGSAIAAAIACGYQDRANRAFFYEWMPTIFRKSLLRRINPFNSKYSDKGLNEALRSIYGGKLLADRGLSRLLKGDWPKTIDELEARRKH